MPTQIGRMTIAAVVSATCVVAGGVAAVRSTVEVAASGTATVWLQTMDACQQAIPGAGFTLSSTSLSQVAGPGKGAKPVTVAAAPGGCPLQRGNCTTVPSLTGCVSWNVPIPDTGTVTYSIRQSRTPKGYVPCTGGSACRDESVQLSVDATGTVTAKVTNIYPDGTSVVWPTSGSYSGAETDPIVFHDFLLGNGSCDGDGDADDHLAGAPSTHCDSDADAAPPSTPSPSPSAATTTPTASAQPQVTDPPPAVAPAPSVSPLALPDMSIPTMPPMPALTPLTLPATPSTPATLPTSVPPAGDPVAAPAVAPSTSTSAGTGAAQVPNLASVNTGSHRGGGPSARWLVAALVMVLVIAGGAVGVRRHLLRRH
jgi:hypothetical protein